MSTKYYHASTITGLKPGDIIDPRNKVCGGVLFMSSSPTSHFTLYLNGENSVQKGNRRLTLYKVQPQGKVYSGGWDELSTMKHVVVLENLGSPNKNGNCSYVHTDGRCYIKKKNNNSYFLESLKKPKS